MITTSTSESDDICLSVRGYNTDRQRGIVRFQYCVLTQHSFASVGLTGSAIIDVGRIRSRHCGQLHPTLNAQTDAGGTHLLISVDPTASVIHYCDPLVTPQDPGGGGVAFSRSERVDVEHDARGDLKRRTLFFWYETLYEHPLLWVPANVQDMYV